MAFRNKAEAILKMKPDVLIIQECEHVDKLTIKYGKRSPSSMVWHGENQHKGIAVFGFNGYEVSLMDIHNPDIKLILPIKIQKQESLFTMLAIWAHNPGDPEGRYVEQIWKAIHHYDAQLTDIQTILVGDFNSNTIWDRKMRQGNHSNVVKKLLEKDIHSCYHHYFDQVQGKEKHPTFYLYRHKDKAYHMDYCFVSGDMMQNIDRVQIGRHAQWSKYSDHAPIIVSFSGF